MEGSAMKKLFGLLGWPLASALVTVVGVLITILFNDLKDDMTEIKTDVKSDMAEIKTDVKAIVDSLGVLNVKVAKGFWTDGRLIEQNAELKVRIKELEARP